MFTFATERIRAASTSAALNVHSSLSTHMPLPVSSHLKLDIILIPGRRHHDDCALRREIASA